jgi:Cu-Zn family superoxide dismutase
MKFRGQTVYVYVLLAIVVVVAVSGYYIKEAFESLKTGVAIFKDPNVAGVVNVTPVIDGVRIDATFTYLIGYHGFHIHKGKSCEGVCDHFNMGPASNHGGPPGSLGPRHTGDLGNVTKGTFTYFLKGVKLDDLIGRSLVVHADRDDLGKGNFSDSLTTGHSGARMACAIIGRA